jgi:hypothetical protein
MGSGGARFDQVSLRSALTRRKERGAALRSEKPGQIGNGIGNQISENKAYTELLTLPNEDP